MIREMQFAGLFYEENTIQLEKNMQTFFQGKFSYDGKAAENTLEPQAKQKTRICLLPHAGHIYSGKVTAETLAEIHLPRKLIILCPNHTGLGRHGAVWENGAFMTPFGLVPVAEDVAGRLLKTKWFCKDYLAHQKEHSIEVILPFLQYTMGQELEIVPISLAGMENLPQMAESISQCMQEYEETGLVVSSDMNHFAAEKENKRKDFLALEAIRALNEEALVRTVIENDISMCGVLGAYVAVLAAKKLNLQNCRLAGYDTSASVSGDTSRVVGYAGLYFY